MPTLKAAYDNLNDVPETIRDYYTERDGKFIISAEGVHTDNDISNLKSALDAERRRAAEAGRSAKPWADLSAELGEELSPQKVREVISGYSKLKEELQAITQNEKRAIDVAVAERVKTLEDKAAQERQRIAETLEAERQRANTYEKIVKDGQFTTAISRAVGEHIHPSAVEDVVTRAQRFGWQLTEDGDLLAYTGKGDTIYSERDPRAPIGLDEWVQDKLFKEAPHFFKQSEGTGDRSKGNFRGTKFPAKRSQMTAEQKAAFLNEHNLEEFMALDQ